MKFKNISQAELTVFCLGLAGATFLAVQAAPKPKNGMPFNSTPITVSQELQKRRGPNYWPEQRKEFQAMTDNTWAQEQWTGGDTPYAAARSRIESVVAAGQAPEALAAQYAVQAKNEPNNAVAQFSWAYAVRLADKDSPASKAASDRIFATCVEIAETPSPHSYNYDRLRYLLWLQWGNGAASHFLKDMAYRLLAKDPKDFPVLIGLASIYTQNKDKAAQQKGYALIQKMIHDYPSKPEAYDMLGGWYYTQYMFYHNPKNYHLAMSNHQKSLGMYPPASPRRAGLPEVMDFLTQRYHQISAGGT
jgi:hypothetical protein